MSRNQIIFALVAVAAIAALIWLSRRGRIKLPAFLTLPGDRARPEVPRAGRTLQLTIPPSPPIIRGKRRRTLGRWIRKARRVSKRALNSSLASTIASSLGGKEGEETLASARTSLNSF